MTGAAARPLRVGSKGPDVGRWQRVLIAAGHDLGPSQDDGDFGERTHNATCAWQKARGLPVTGVVTSAEWILSTHVLDPLPPTVRAFDLDRVPYVEAANWQRNAPPQSKRLIVIHCMEAAEASTTAESVAAWFAGKRGETPQTSAHFCVDSDSVICCLHSDRIAWHAPGANKDGIGIELAGYARQSREDWLDAYSTAMLQLAAKLVRALSRRHGIPLTFVDVAGVRGQQLRGVTTHAVVSEAFGKSSHTDPGPHFPMDLLLGWAGYAT